MSDTINPIAVATAPDIDGLTFRGFAGPDDFPAMVRVWNAAAQTDGIEQINTLEEISRNYGLMDPERCNTATDMIMAELDDALVAYGRLHRFQELDGKRVYLLGHWIDPVHRGTGLKTAILDWMEGRAEAIARTVDADDPHEARVLVFGSQPQTVSLLEARGYVLCESHAVMVRPNLADLPDVQLPHGFVVRTPVTEEDFRKVWDADVEAFRDHVGWSEPGEKSYERFRTDPHQDPTLWRIAWHGDEVAGQVRAFIDKDENAHFNRKRGWTEDISVRRPYRRRGLARALIVLSLQALKERGMQEAALEVHVDNPTGAFHLYESLGYAVVRREAEYSKPIEL
ncbi:MAG: GNAT family N-acetyltransferase [Anaerolineae bacterium]